MKIRRAKKIWGTREKNSPFIRKKTAFFGPSYFEVTLEHEFGKALKTLKRGKNISRKFRQIIPLCGVALSHTQIWVICLWAKVHKSVEFVHCVRATSGVSQRAIAP